MKAVLFVAVVSLCGLEMASPICTKKIFQGLRIFVFTQGIGPVRFQILRRLVCANGGTLANSISVDVNVLVADDNFIKISDASKLQNIFEKCSSEAILVSARWITDSVDSSRLLDSQPFHILGNPCPQPHRPKQIKIRETTPAEEGTSARLDPPLAREGGLLATPKPAKRPRSMTTESSPHQDAGFLPAEDIIPIASKNLCPSTNCTHAENLTHISAVQCPTHAAEASPFATGAAPLPAFRADGVGFRLLAAEGGGRREGCVRLRDLACGDLAWGSSHAHAHARVHARTCARERIFAFTQCASMHARTHARSCTHARTPRQTA
jgi:hypothetical protein